MGMKYKSQRLLKRALFGAAPLTAAAVILIVFVLGFMLGMAFVAEPSKMGFVIRDVMSGSSWADWTAALSAAVIGYAALRFQVSSAKQASLEADERKKRERSARIASLTSIKSRARRLYAMAFQCYEAVDKKDVSSSDVFTQMTVSLSAIDAATWSETEKALLNPDTVTRIGTIELLIPQFRVACEETQRCAGRLNGQELDKITSAWLETLKQIAQKLRDRAEIVEREVDTKIEQA